MEETEPAASVELNMLRWRLHSNCPTRGCFWNTVRWAWTQNWWEGEGKMSQRRERINHGWVLQANTWPQPLSTTINHSSLTKLYRRDQYEDYHQPIGLVSTTNWLYGAVSKITDSICKAQFRKKTLHSSFSLRRVKRLLHISCYTVVLLNRSLLSGLLLSPCASFILMCSRYRLFYGCFKWQKSSSSTQYMYWAFFQKQEMATGT